MAHFFTMEVPRLKRCKSDRNRYYQVILQSVFTKDIYVIKVKDVSLNCIRFYLNIQLPCELPAGEYNYFIVTSEDWAADMLDPDIIRKTGYLTDKEAVSNNGMFIVFGDKLLVTKYFRAKLYSGGKAVTAWGNDFAFKQASQDVRGEGEIIRHLDILGNGLLKYDTAEPIVENVKAYKNRKRYKAYGK